MCHAPTIAAPRLRPTLQSPARSLASMCLKNQRLDGILMVHAPVGLAASCGGLLRPIAANAEDGQADRRRNCRGVNRLEIGMCAVTLAWLAATTRGSPGARLSQPVERTANAKPAAVKHV